MVDCDSRTDAELVALSLQNQEYFYCLMQRYEKKLLRYICRLTNISKEEAEDILQEVFIKTYRNLNDFDPDLKFSSWIYRITHNEVISHYRRSRPQIGTVSLDSENEEGQSLSAFIQDTIRLDDSYVTQEISRKVREVIYALPAQYKEILILRYLEEKDYKEIGDILRKPSGTIATLISRSKKHFKKEAQRRKLNTLL